jgi:hypothetical protein
VAQAFTPGARTLYSLDLSKVPAGQLPQDIKVLEGTMNVVMKDGVPMLGTSERTNFLVRLPEIMPQDFTLEFEIIPKDKCGGEDLAFEGTEIISQSDVSMLVLWESSNLRLSGGGEYVELPMPENFLPTIPAATVIQAGFQGGQFSLYTNGRRLLSRSARSFARNRFIRVFLGGSEECAVHLSKLRVATSIPATVRPTPAPVSSLPLASRTSVRPPATRGAVAKSMTVQRCGLFSTLRTTVVKADYARLEWGGVNCEGAAAENAEHFDDQFMVRAPTADPKGCPTEYQEMLSTATLVTWKEMGFSAYPGCRLFMISPGVFAYDDYKLTPGESYTYRFWATYYRVCTMGTADCPYGRIEYVSDPAELEVTLPLARVSRPDLKIVPPRLDLLVTMGQHQCVLWDCEVTVSYAWSPAPNAVGYILAFSVYGGQLFLTPLDFWASLTSKSVAASPTPSTTETFGVLNQWDDLRGATLRTCIAIVYDAARPPNPNEGECVDAVFP